METLFPLLASLSEYPNWNTFLIFIQKSWLKTIYGSCIMLGSVLAQKYQLRTFLSCRSHKVFWTAGSFLGKCPHTLSALPGSSASGCQLWSWCRSPTFEQLQYWVSWPTDWKDTQASGRTARWPHRRWAQDFSSTTQELFISPEQQLFRCCNHFVLMKVWLLSTGSIEALRSQLDS